MIYSDNIRLAPSGEEESDFVLRAIPGITLSSSGARYDLSLNYSLEAYYFLDQDDNTGVFNLGNAALDLALLPETLFWKSSASISQVVVDPSQTITYTNLPLTDNRTDQRRLETGLRWQQDILGNALLADFTLGQTNYDDPEVQDVEFSSVTATLVSPDVERGFGWQAIYEYEVYSYDVPPDLKRQLAELSLAWTVGGGWTPFGSFGLESDLTDLTDASLTDEIWRIGVRRRSERSFFEVYGGERSYGTWFGVTLEFRGSDPGNVFVVRYRETPTTSETIDQTRPVNEPGAVPPPVLPPDLVGPGVRQLYVRKEGRLTLTRRLSRSDLSFEAFWERDEDLIPQGRPDEVADLEQIGGSISFGYNVGQRTRVVAEVLMAWRDYGTFRVDPEVDDDDRLLRIRGTLDYALGERTNLQAWAGHEAQQGSVSRQFVYRENQVGLTLGRTF